MKKFVLLFLCMYVCQPHQSLSSSPLEQLAQLNIAEFATPEIIWKTISLVAIGYVFLREIIIPCGKRIFITPPAQQQNFDIRRAFENLQSGHDATIKRMMKFDDKYKKMKTKINQFSQLASRINLCDKELNKLEHYYDKRLADLQNQGYHHSNEIRRVDSDMIYVKGIIQQITDLLRTIEVPSNEISPPFTPRTFTSLVTNGLSSGITRSCSIESPRPNIDSQRKDYASQLRRQASINGTLHNMQSTESLKKNLNVTTSAEKKPFPTYPYSGIQLESSSSEKGKSRSSSPEEDTLDSGTFVHIEKDKGEDNTESDISSGSDEEKNSDDEKEKNKKLLKK